MDNGVSVADLVNQLQPHRDQILTGLVAVPLGGALLGRVLLSVQERVGAWFLSALVHLATFLLIPPGFVLFYLLLGTSTNLLTDVDALFLFGPLVSGFLTLVLIPQIMPFEQIPGFDRILGLAGLVGLSFGSVFVISRTHFIGLFRMNLSLGSMLLMAGALFVVFRIFLGMAFGQGRKPDLDLDLEDMNS